MPSSGASTRVVSRACGSIAAWSATGMDAHSQTGAIPGRSGRLPASVTRLRHWTSYSAFAAAFPLTSACIIEHAHASLRYFEDPMADRRTIAPPCRLASLRSMLPMRCSPCGRGASRERSVRVGPTPRAIPACDARATWFPNSISSAAGPSGANSPPTSIGSGAADLGRRIPPTPS